MPHVQHHCDHCDCLVRPVSRGRSITTSHSIRSPDPVDPRSSNEMMQTTTWTTFRSGVSISDAGNRRKVAKALSTVANYLGTASEGQFDDSEFKRGKALDFPEIPGEEGRNSELPRM